MTIEEEEDTSKGDVLDVLTPREMATTRYVQHHEWMEEVMGSAYPISRIKPVDLGLGLVGDLESVTKGLLDPPVFPAPKPKINDPVKEEKDPKELLKRVKARAAKKVREMEEEMRVMRETHEARMQKIKETSVYRDAEIELRGGLGLEMFLPGLHTTTGSAGDGDEDSDETVAREAVLPVADDDTTRSVEEVVSEFQSRTGKKIIPSLAVVQYQLPEDEIVKMGGVVAAQQQQVDSVMDNNDDPDDDGTFKLDIPTPPTHESTAGGLLDEFEAAANAQAEDTAGALMEDTIMDDFMNVDDTPSKPATPRQQSASAPTAADTNATATPASGEELFTIPPTDGATSGLDLGTGGGGAAQ